MVYRSRDNVRNHRLLRPSAAVGRGYSGWTLLRYPDGTVVRVRCGTFMVGESLDRFGRKKQFRCRVMVWLPGGAVPLIGEGVGSERCFDRALEALNGLLAKDGLELMVVGNVPGTVDDGLGPGSVFRRYRGKRCLLIDPVIED